MKKKPRLKSFYRLTAAQWIKNAIIIHFHITLFLYSLCSIVTHMLLILFSFVCVYVCVCAWGGALRNQYQSLNIPITVFVKCRTGQSLFFIKLTARHKINSEMLFIEWIEDFSKYRMCCDCLFFLMIPLGEKYWFFSVDWSSIPNWLISFNSFTYFRNVTYLYIIKIIIIIIYMYWPSG